MMRFGLCAISPKQKFMSTLILRARKGNEKRRLLDKLKPVTRCRGRCQGTQGVATAFHTYGAYVEANTTLGRICK